jgi:hypothetical protein
MTPMRRREAGPPMRPQDLCQRAAADDRLRRARATPLRTDPYEWALVRDAIRPADAALLVDTFPSDLLFPLIVADQLERRLDGVRVTAFAPFGDPPRAFTGAYPVRSLGAGSAASCAALRDELDLFLVGGGEIGHDHADGYASVYGRGVGEIERSGIAAWRTAGSRT